MASKNIVSLPEIEKFLKDNRVRKEWKEMIWADKEALTTLRRCVFMVDGLSESYLPDRHKILFALSFKAPTQVTAMIVSDEPHPALGTGMERSWICPRAPAIGRMKDVLLQAGVEVSGDVRPDYTEWAKHGVLLLTTLLTVAKYDGEKKSREKHSFWLPFTQRIVQLAQLHSKHNVVGMFWGDEAKQIHRFVIHNNLRFQAYDHPETLVPYPDSKIGSNNFTAKATTQFKMFRTSFKKLSPLKTCAGGVKATSDMMLDRACRKRKIPEASPSKKPVKFACKKLVKFASSASSKWSEISEEAPPSKKPVEFALFASPEWRESDSSDSGLPKTPPNGYITRQSRAFRIKDVKTEHTDAVMCRDDRILDIGGIKLEEQQREPETEYEFLQKTLNQKALNFLHDMEDSCSEIVLHTSLLRHVQNYIEDVAAMFPEEYGFESRSDLGTVLNKLVLSEVAAYHAVHFIHDDIVLSKSASYWAQRYLEDSLPADQDTSYPVKPEYRDTWTSHSFTLPLQYARRTGGGANGPRPEHAIKVMNAQTKKMMHFNEERGVQHYYHGTTHRSACDILKIGIKLTKGKSACDYSDGDGFYVTKDYSHARKWAHSRPGSPALIVFKSEKNIFSDPMKHIHLQQNNPNTGTILRHFTSGCVEEIEAVEQITNPTVDECESISGPMIRDFPSFKAGRSCELYGSQICIRKQKCADDFFLCIDRIIFFPRQRRPPLSSSKGQNIRVTN